MGARAETAALAARIVDAMSAPFDLDGHQVVIGVSIGVAFAPADGTDAVQLLKAADLALYRAKADGRSTYRFFEPGMDRADAGAHRVGGRSAQSTRQRASSRCTTSRW